MMRIRGKIMMFREMRRIDRKISDDQAKDLLKNNTYGVMSTIGADGYPYGVPLNYVFFNDAIYFHCAADGHKFDNISRDNKISFCVVGQIQVLPDKFSTKYESVIIFGRATEIFDNEKNIYLAELINKYSADYIEQGKEYIQKGSRNTKVVKLSIEHISGKARR